MRVADFFGFSFIESSGNVVGVGLTSNISVISTKSSYVLLNIYYVEEAAFDFVS